MKLLIASAIFSVVVTIAPGFAQGDCNHPGNVADQERCFLSWFPCEYSFFGVNASPDYAKALACFDKSRRPGPFVALMYINGDGTPRDLQKAEAALGAWKQNDPDEFNDDQAATLQAAIDKCKHGGQKSCPRIDFCEQLAENTFDSEMCDAIEQVRAEAKLSQKVARVGSALDARDRALFDQVFSEFKAYELEEMRRGYAATEPGTARGVAGLGQAAFARDNFLKLIAETVERRELKSADAGQYRALDDELARIYRADIREAVAVWHDDLNDPESKKIRDEARSYIADYKQAAQQSQVHWISFRDSYAKLANSLYKQNGNVSDPARAAKMAVTKLRIAELRYVPLLGGPETN